MLRYADVLWAPELQHLVQCSDGNGHLGQRHSTRWQCRSRMQLLAHLPYSGT
jgi:hypothetical protein